MTNNNECDVIATIKPLDLTENIQEEMKLNDLNSEKSVEVVKNKHELVLRFYTTQVTKYIKVKNNKKLHLI